MVLHFGDDDIVAFKEMFAPVAIGNEVNPFCGAFNKNNFFV